MDFTGAVTETSEEFASPEQVSRRDIEPALGFASGAGVETFRLFFRHLRNAFPKETTKAILRQLAAEDLSGFQAEAVEWLASTDRYLPFLLDVEFLTRDEALRVAKRLRSADQTFFSRFATLTEGIGNALGLLKGLGGYDPLFWWLYSLTRHPEERVRSRAAKMVCEIRPNTELIERQLQSTDARVRANAIEALWPVRTLHADHLLRQGVSDNCHRVVMNALVGLHLHGNQDAFGQICRFTQHSSPLFQAAAAWALGCVGDARGTPFLEELASGRCAMVRKRAHASLEKLPSQEAPETI